MKKKRWDTFPYRESISKIIRVMKLVSFILLAGFMQVAANVYSQNANIRLSMQDVKLDEVIKAIQKQTEFTFFYSPDDIRDVTISKIDLEKATLEKTLDLCLKGTNLAYEIIYKAVILKKTEDHDQKSPDLPTQQKPEKKELSGTAKDTKGLPLPGVTVVAKGTTTGTITDNDGKFRLSVPTDAKTLVFSFIGMKSQEFLIAGTITFNVVMEEEAVGLDELVVVGYGFQKKESVVGAISQIDSKALVNSGTTNVTNAIAGKLSGVLTIQNSGEPGANNSEIIIRGLSSWNGSAPLVMVDGVERDFSGLDPNEINTISVLKDASATAVFGAKGANGVIIVTTKRGNIGKPKLDFSAAYGLQRATMIPDHISSYTTLSMLNVANMNEGNFQNLITPGVLNEYRNPSTPLNALRYPDVNWFKVSTRPFAQSFNANVNISGGTNFVKYFCSLGYSNEGDFFDQKKEGYYDLSYNYKRFNYRTNVDFQLTKSSTLSFNLGGTIGVKNGNGAGPWTGLYSTSSARFPAYFPAWVLEMVPDPVYPDAKGIRLADRFGGYRTNPYTDFNNGSFVQNLDSKLFTDILFRQNLDFITKGLSFKGQAALSTDYTNGLLQGSQYFPEYILNYEDIGKTGVNPWVRTGQGMEYYQMPPLNLSIGSLGSNYRNLYYELGFNYSNTFGRHSVTGLALMNRSQKNSGTEFAYYNSALVGRATYDFAHKYLFEMNVGYTGSERFAPGNRYGIFPSAAIGWVVSEEKFFKNAIPWVNKLKFRYSDGLTGSDAAGSRWLYMGGFKTSSGYIYEDKVANIDAQWERARKRDLGLEIGLFRNVFNISVDLFDEYRDKMLLTPRSVTFLVANSFKDLNLGSFKKHGYEVELGFNKTTPTQFNYWAKAILGFNENRVIFKDDLAYSPDYVRDASKPLGYAKGSILTGTGYYTSVNDIQNNLSSIGVSKTKVGDYKFLDYTVDGIINSLDKYPIAGNTYPPYTYSFSSGFRYKKFEFSFMFQGNKGKYVSYTDTYEVEFTYGEWRVHTSQLDYWTPANPDANHSTLHFSTTGGAPAIMANMGSVEGRTWRNSDYLRLKEVYAGYNFSPKFLNSFLGVSNILCYATANDLWTITDLVEGDPERKDFSMGFYPQLTSVKLGVKVAF
jgi:TonB-linked SusC/RagA family outer membrane protein